MSIYFHYILVAIGFLVLAKAIFVLFYAFYAIRKADKFFEDALNNFTRKK